MREKAAKDYAGDFRRILDVVRASGIFHSIIKFMRGIEGVHDDDRLEIVRIKDRVTNPLDNGYRDVLLNVKMAGFDLVVELQLHVSLGRAAGGGGHS